MMLWDIGLVIVANNRTKASAVRLEDTGILLPAFARLTRLVVLTFVMTQLTAQTQIGACGQTMGVLTATLPAEPVVIRLLPF